MAIACALITVAFTTYCFAFFFIFQLDEEQLLGCTLKTFQQYFHEAMIRMMVVGVGCLSNMVTEGKSPNLRRRVVQWLLYYGRLPLPLTETN